MELDVVTLSRVQFALTVMFHYLFPPLTIGLGAVMVFMEAMYLRTKNMQYERMTRFWTGIFAVNFAMGVASGIVMEFQFGTNWATYSRFVGDVFGSALAAEGVFAFFLESGFLGVLVFGWDRVSPKMHFFATLMVALGSMFSAVWIVVANSWQQTPAGFHIVNGRAEITDFWAMVFNPSAMIRLTHTLLGALILGAFVVMSISAWYLLKNKHTDFAKRSFGIALLLAAVVSVVQLWAGHSHGQQVARTQPAKLAAYEGLFKTPDGPAPLHVFGWPDVQNETVKFPLAIPGGLSFLATNDWNGKVVGLDAFPVEDRPPVVVPFVSFHVMVALGFYFIGLTLFGLFHLWRGSLFNKRWLLWVFVVSVIAPYVANQLGWVAAEVGRQPWNVYGQLRTVDSVSKSVPASHVLTSIIMFSFIYLLLFAVWVYVMNDKIQKGPKEEGSLPEGAPATGLLDAAIAYQDPAGPSLTGARDDLPEENNKEGK